MKLEEIGFYTLSDYRVRQLSETSPIWRAELLLTGACNFSCPYCRGLHIEGKQIKGHIPFEQALKTLTLWIKDGLKNVRFSGGEPTLYPRLNELVRLCKVNNVEHIAISTNGSAKLDLYKQLVKDGINDFSISLDACCASVGDKMAGVGGKWEIVISNIRELSKLTYVTVGIVLTQENVNTISDIVKFADGLGVADIRIISAAQYNQLLEGVKNLPDDLLDRHPILKYRVNNIRNGINVRGLSPKDCSRCCLPIDDTVSVGEYHYPCVIYMREGGKPIGKVGENMRKERYEWSLNHDILNDKICSGQCLDVCKMYNQKVLERTF